MACRVIVLEDNDILHLERGSYSIYNLQRDDPSAKMSSVSRALNRLDMEVRPCSDACALQSCICVSATRLPPPATSMCLPDLCLAEAVAAIMLVLQLEGILSLMLGTRHCR